MALELAEKRRSERKVPVARPLAQKCFDKLDQSAKTKKAETNSAFWSRSLLGGDIWNGDRCENSQPGERFQCGRRDLLNSQALTGRFLDFAFRSKNSA
jgi:hypothetical protein